MLAAYKARAVPININYRYVEDELRYIFDNADLVALVFERSFTPKVAAVLPDLPRLRHLVVLDDGSDRDASAIGAVRCRNTRLRRSHLSATSAPARPTTSTSSTQAAPLACPRV